MSLGFFPRARQLDYEVHWKVKQANMGGGKLKNKKEEEKTDIKNHIKQCVIGASISKQINPEIETIAYGNEYDHIILFNLGRNFREVFNLVVLEQLDKQKEKLESVPHTGYQIKFEVYQRTKWKNTTS